MPKGKDTKLRVRVLVKAFPQRSKKYEETVCCAGVREDTGELIRLYPIRFRRLESSCRFTRYDLIELVVSKAPDPRPESYRVSEDSIEVIQRASPTNFPAERRAALWRPFIYSSLSALKLAQKESSTSLGIICPEDPSFYYSVDDKNEEETKQIAEEQLSMFEKPLAPIERPKYNFHYRFASNGTPHNAQIQDWEVQEAYRQYVKRYGDEQSALDMISQEYGENIPQRNLHFVMGTMLRYPWQFILIGVLRCSVNPADVQDQLGLFNQEISE